MHTFASAAQLAKCLQLEELEVLDVSATEGSSLDLEWTPEFVLEALLPFGKRLKELSFCSPLSTARIAGVLLQACPNLWRLHIESNLEYDADEKIDALAAELGGHAMLRYISLDWRFHFSDDEVRALLDGLPRLEVCKATISASVKTAYPHIRFAS